MNYADLCEICQELPATSNTFGVHICNKQSCNEEVYHEARRRREAEERKERQEEQKNMVEEFEEVPLKLAERAVILQEVIDALDSGASHGHYCLPCEPRNEADEALYELVKVLENASETLTEILESVEISLKIGEQIKAGVVSKTASARKKKRESKK